MFAGLCSFLEVGFFPSKFMRLSEFTWGCRTEVPLFSCWLSPGLLLSPKYHSWFLVMWLFVSHSLCHNMVADFKASRRISGSSLLGQSLTYCNLIKEVTLPYGFALLHWLGASHSLCLHSGEGTTHWAVTSGYVHCNRRVLKQTQAAGRIGAN